MQSKSTVHRFRIASAAWILVAACASVAVAAQVYVVPETDGDGTAYLGVRLREEVDHDEGGARVTGVVGGSPADEAGLREDDIVVEFDGHVIRGPAGLTQRIHARRPGDRVKLVVDRSGKRRTFEVDLGEREPVEGLTLLPDARAYVPDAEKLKEWSEHLREQSKAWNERAHEFTVAPEVWGIFSGKPRLGVELVETTPELRRHLGGPEGAGILISRILPGTPAERAGLRVGDLIVSVDGHEIDDSRSLIRELDDLVGETFPVRIVRDKKTLTVEVKIDEPDEDVPSGPRACLRPFPPAAASVPTPPLPAAPALAPSPPLPAVPVVAPTPPPPPRPTPAVAPPPRPPRPEAIAPPAAPQLPAPPEPDRSV